MWGQASRGQLDEDPVVFASKDTVSLLAGVIVVLLLIVATLDTVR